MKPYYYYTEGMVQPNICGVELEVEGVRYIEMYRGPGGVNACHVEYVRLRVPRLPRARYRVMAS